MGSGTARLKAEDDELQEMLEDLDIDSLRYAEDVFSPLVFTVVLGVEYLLPIEFLNSEWAVESRVQYAFTNIYNEDQGTNYKVFEVALMVSCGLRILGSKDRRVRIR